MRIEAIKYEDKLKKDWERFVKSSDNGTIFHLMDFLSYHPKEKFKTHNLIFFEKENIKAVFPAVIKEDSLISHPGASYGGFVMKDFLGIKQTIKLVEELIQYSKDCGFKRIELTQTPIIYYKYPCNYIDFALIKSGFKYKKRELSAVISLDFEGPVLSTFKQEARTSVRKAKKTGVVVKESQNFTDYYEILKNNLSMRHNVLPTHTLDEIILLHSIFPENIKLYGAFLGDKLIAGVIIFETNSRVLLAFYISHNALYKQYRPVNLLIHEIMNIGRNSKYKYLDLGTFTLNMEPDFGLARFKESFRARGYFRDTLYLEI